jgi:3-dehydroquinate synthase
MKPSDCEIAIDPHGFKHVAEYLQKIKGKWTSALIVTDQQVWKHYGQEITINLMRSFERIEIFALPEGESSKNLENVSKCWNTMQQKGLDKSSLVISLGGGVASDMAGFVAATYMRGLDLVQLPTSLLGMVDASIGGKNGVNVPNGKNLIGTLHHPRLILIDPTCLKTLSDKEFRSGLAEVIKYGVVWDPEFFHYLEVKMPQILEKKEDVLATMISRSCEIKTEIVRKNEKDKGLRAILNWGHTFAHAIEAATHYTQYSHGEAVAIGMSCAAYLSYVLGCVDEEFIAKQDELIKKAGLDITLPNVDNNTLISLMAKDKKATNGRFSFIVARKIGKAAQMDNVEKNLIVKALDAKRGNA